MDVQKRQAESGLAMIVRPAVAGDLAAVDALFAASYPRLLAPDYPPSVLVTAVPILARARPDLLVSGTYWVAQDGDGMLLGAGGWTPGGPGGGATRPGLGHVRHVVTRAGLQRRGIGRAILARAMAQAESAGIGQLECLSTRTAVPFYAALGFRTLGAVEVPLRPGIVFPALRMVRDLGPGAAGPG